MIEQYFVEVISSTLFLSWNLNLKHDKSLAN